MSFRFVNSLFQITLIFIILIRDPGRRHEFRRRIGVDGLIVKVDMGPKGLKDLLFAHPAQKKGFIDPYIPGP